MSRSAIHPGEHLADAIEGMGISAAELAREIRVPANRVTAILHGSRSITADTALRLARYFSTSAEFWLNLQQIYELRKAQQELGAQIKDIPRGKAEWREDNPLAALDIFLKTHQEFEIDPHYTRLHVTSNPAGFLKRLAK